MGDYVKILLLIASVLFLSGCLGISPTQEGVPPGGYKEVRCTCINGDGRYGTLLTNYIKGQGDFCKLTTFGDLQPSTSLTCQAGVTSIKVDASGTDN